MPDDVVAELDAELALIEQLPYRVPIHLLAKRARDEIVALRVQLDAVRGIAGNERRLSEAIAQQARAEAHEELQAARREIVALRRTIRLGPDLPALARDEALEEAARLCDALYDGYSTANTDQTDPEQVWLDACDRAATAIRALKEKRDD